MPYKTDRNQKEIVQDLRDIPALSVHNTAMVGDGFPDIVVGFRGANWLFEIKDGELPYPSQRQLNEREKQFHEEWNGQVHKVENTQEILEIMGLSQGE